MSLPVSGACFRCSFEFFVSKRHVSVVYFTSERKRGRTGERAWTSGGSGGSAELPSPPTSSSSQEATLFSFFFFFSFAARRHSNLHGTIRTHRQCLKASDENERAPEGVEEPKERAPRDSRRDCAGSRPFFFASKHAAAASTGDDGGDGEESLSRVSIWLPLTSLPWAAALHAWCRVSLRENERRKTEKLAVPTLFFSPCRKKKRERIDGTD